MGVLKRSCSIPAMAALWLAAAGASFAATKDEPATPYVHADGTLIRDEQDRPLHLRGVNLGGWLCWEGWIFGGGFESQSTILERLSSLTGAEAAGAFRDAVHARFIAEPDIARIATMGFNVVRVPLNYRLLEDDARPGAYKDAGWQVLDRLLGWCEAHRVYVVLDLHAAPGGQSKLFMADPPDPARGALLWDDEACQARTVALWAAIAARYRDRRIVAGYDLLNEPAPPDGKALARLYERMIAGIRAADPHHMIFVEGSDFARDFSMFDRPPAPNVAYSFHMYTWFGDDRRTRLDGFRATARKHNVPLWCGEFGENGYEMIRSTVAMYEDPAGLVSGYAFWTWKKAPTSHPGLMVIAEPPPWRDLIRWIAKRWFARRPTPEEAAVAIREFLDAAACDRPREDPQMRDALQPPHRDGLAPKGAERPPAAQGAPR